MVYFKRRDTMNIKALFSKPKFYFLAIVPLLLATALIRVECPVCGGAGTVSGSANMDRVHIVSLESRILSSTQDACTGYVVTKARPVITLFNVGTEAAEGWLTVSLMNAENGEMLAERHMAVEIGAEKTVVLDSYVAFAFYSADVPPENLDIKAEALTGSVPDPVCGGSGKTGLNTYFLARAFKERLVSTVQTEIEFGPDLSHGEPGSKEWLDWWELS
jgi:hypothetical protein